MVNQNYHNDTTNNNKVYKTLKKSIEKIFFNFTDRKFQSQTLFGQVWDNLF
jgi:hypothetical protein